MHGSLVGMVKLTELLERAHPLSLPLRTPFRGIRQRDVVLFEAEEHWVEWAPFLEYPPEVAARWLRHAVDFGFGCCAAKPQRTRVEVNATIPASVAVTAISSGDAHPQLHRTNTQNHNTVDALMQRYPGCATVKIKVAEYAQASDGPIPRDVEQDVARINAVRAWFAQRGQKPAIRIDANGAWTPQQAHHAVEAFLEAGPLDYVEQPCSTVAHLAELRHHLRRQGLPVRIAADESIRTSGDPRTAVQELVQRQAVDVAVLKVPPLGGVDPLLGLAKMLAEHGIAVSISSALDTAVGIGAGLYAAACLPEPAQAAGLATGSLFAVDVARRTIVDGHMDVGDVSPDPAVLHEYALRGQRKDWWLGRLRQAWSVL